MIKKLFLLHLFIIMNLSPFRGISAEESDPCMGDDPVSPVLIDYYKEFNQLPDTDNHIDSQPHSINADQHPLQNALVNYYSEFLK